MTILQIRAEQTYPLRQAILRPGLPIETCMYPGDDAPETVHFGAVLDGRIVGIASLYHEAPPGESNPQAWRLRGMAVDEALRRQGIGRELLLQCVVHVAGQGGTMLWFNARTVAVPFYEKHGFATRGDEFEIPGVGPHYVMWQEFATA